MGRLAFALIACGLVAQQSQPPSPGPTKAASHDKKQAKGKTDKTAGNQSVTDPVVTAIGNLSSEVHSWKDQDHGDRQKNNSSPDWGIIGTIISAAATVVIAWLAHRQRQAMDKQADYMRDGLAETKRAADAAKDAADISKRSLYMSQRPLVTVEVTMVGGIYEQALGTTDADKLRQSSVRIAFRNLGNTVARDFYFSVWIIGPDRRHLIIVSHKVPMVPGGTVEESTKLLGSILSHYEIAGLNAQAVKVCGFARYKTLFDELPGTYTEFHALWDKSIRQFRISAEEREDGGYPEPS